MKISKITKTYKEVIANNNITYEFPDKGFVFILGKSGCGKSTLLNILAGLTKPDTGEIFVGESNIVEYNELKMDQYRNLDIGIIFQSYNLINELSVYDNLRIAIEIQDREQSRIDEEIRNILKQVNLEGYENRKIAQLSGGEKQRIAIARALLKETKIILADEPTGNLDFKTGEVVLKLLAEISKKKLVIMVSHDEMAAKKYADTIIRMKDGTIVDVRKTDKSVSFTFKLRVGNEEIQYENLSKEQMVSLIDEAIDSNSDIGITEIDKIEKIDEPEEEISQGLNIQAKKLGYKYILGLAVKFMSTKKLRMIFTTLIFTLSFVLIYFAMYISNYNKSKVISKYLSQNNKDILPVYMTKEYKSDMGVEHALDFSCGKYINNCLEKSVSSGEIVRARYNETLYVEDEEKDEVFIETTFLFLKQNGYCPDKIIGKKPEKKDEIIITDYLADLFSVGIGDSICGLRKEYMICGIIDTEYKKYGLQEKLDAGYISDELNFECDNKYYVVGVLEDNILDEYENRTYLTMMGTDLTTQKLDDYISVDARYSTVENIETSDLKFGRLPVKENEILVSGFIADRMGINEKNLDEKYLYRDLHNEKYNNCYSYLINMNSYFPEGIVITGVIKDEFENDYYINADIFNEIKKEYLSYYDINYVVAPNYSKIEKLVSEANEGKIEFKEPGINNIRKFNQTLKRIKDILYFVLAIILVINFFTIVVFIGMSISENIRNIGILRAIGIPMSDCAKVFNLEFVFLYFVSMVLSLAGTILLTVKANGVFMSNLFDRKFDIIVFAPIVFGISILIELLIGIISSKIPIKDLKKKNLIELIR